MKEIVIASSNKGKIAEISAAFLPLNIKIISQSELDIPDAEETGLTFLENAIIKARHASHYSGLPAIADDSGLVVPALKGAPGIFSARYAGLNSKTPENIKKLLLDLETTDDKNRRAYFYCALVFLQHAMDPTPLIAEGYWFGEILRKPEGEQGFGYDPIFFDPKQNCSAAALTIDQKNKISHRGKALKSMLEKLKIGK